MYFAHIRNNILLDVSQIKFLNEDILNIEVDEDIYNEIEKYIWDGADLVLDPDYEEKEAQKMERLETKLMHSLGYENPYKDVE